MRRERGRGRNKAGGGGLIYDPHAALPKKVVRDRRETEEVWRYGFATTPANGMDEGLARVRWRRYSSQWSGRRSPLGLDRMCSLLSTGAVASCGLVDTGQPQQQTAMQRQIRGNRGTAWGGRRGWQGWVGVGEWHLNHGVISICPYRRIQSGINSRNGNGGGSGGGAAVLVEQEKGSAYLIFPYQVTIQYHSRVQRKRLAVLGMANKGQGSGAGGGLVKRPPVLFLLSLPCRGEGLRLASLLVHSS